MAALMQGPAMSNYNVAKAGVVALSESLLVELKQQEVGVHVVCPSFFQTNLLDSFRGPKGSVVRLEVIPHTNAPNDQTSKIVSITRFSDASHWHPE